MQMINALAYNNDDIYINTLETSVRTGTTGFSAVGCQIHGARDPPSVFPLSAVYAQAFWN